MPACHQTSTVYDVHVDGDDLLIVIT